MPTHQTSSEERVRARDFLVQQARARNPEFNTPEKRIAYLVQNLGLTPEDARDFNTRLVEPLIGPEGVGPQAAPGITPGRVPTPPPPLPSDGAIDKTVLDPAPAPTLTARGQADVGQQAELFAGQPAREAALRGAGAAFGRPFSEFTTPGQQAISRAFGQFQDVSPITNFFPQQELGAAFGSFLGAPRPTRESLNTELNAILAAVAAEPSAAATFAGGTLGTAPGAAAAAIQPFLASLAPRTRSGVADVLGTEFESRFADRPQEFQTQEQILALIEDFRRRGFLQ